MRKLKGKIVSDKMQKTRVVAVTRLVVHPRYGKRYSVTARFKAHDEKNEYKLGDEVIIKEIRPMSKDKRWEIVEKIK
ncbi:MAG: 30S ribosomal protein S17 [Patescibacteria group bacterium]